MIHPKTLLAEWVTALQSLRNLVDALGGDGGRIQFYTENTTVFGPAHPEQRSPGDFVHAARLGDDRVAWQWTGQARQCAGVRA